MSDETSINVWFRRLRVRIREPPVLAIRRFLPPPRWMGSLTAINIPREGQLSWRTSVNTHRFYLTETPGAKLLKLTYSLFIGVVQSVTFSWWRFRISFNLSAETKSRLCSFVHVNATMMTVNEFIRPKDKFRHAWQLILNYPDTAAMVTLCFHDISASVTFCHFVSVTTLSAWRNQVSVTQVPVTQSVHCEDIRFPQCCMISISPFDLHDAVSSPWCRRVFTAGLVFLITSTPNS